MSGKPTGLHREYHKDEYYSSGQYVNGEKSGTWTQVFKDGTERKNKYEK